MSFVWCDMKDLTARVIKEIWIHEENDIVAFITTKDGTEETLYYVCEGECCSHSYIQHWEGIDSLIGATIKKVDVIEMDEVKDSNDERTLVYGVKFVTNKGRSTLEFRNTSNGYYGGNMVRLYKQRSYIENDKPEPRYGQDESQPYEPIGFPEQWKKLTEDF